MGRFTDKEVLDLHREIEKVLSKNEYIDIMVELGFYKYADFNEPWGEYHGASKKVTLRDTLLELRDTGELPRLVEHLKREELIEGNPNQLNLDAHVGDEAIFDKFEPEIPANSLGRKGTSLNKKRGISLNTKVVVAIITAAATIVGAWIISRSNTKSVELEISATQTAEAREAAITEAPIESQPMKTESQQIISGCFPSQYWNRYGLEVVEENSEVACIPIPDTWGVTPIDSGIEFFRNDVSETFSGALYISLPEDSRVDFDFIIGEMKSEDGRNSYISLGMIGTNPVTDLGKGFFFQVEGQGFPVILKEYQFGPDLRDNNVRIEYPFNTQKHIVITIQRKKYALFIDGERIIGPLEILESDRAFWIGFQISDGGSLDASINSFSIEDL